MDKNYVSPKLSVKQHIAGKNLIGDYSAYILYNSKIYSQTIIFASRKPQNIKASFGVKTNTEARFYFADDKE